MKVYTSLNDEPFKLNSVFTGTLQNPDARAQYVFQKPVNCTKLKLEFNQVSLAISLGFPNEKVAGVNNLVFLRSFDDEAVTYQGITGIYSDDYYTNTHMIPFGEMEYTSNGDKSDKPLSNLFDNTVGTYWVSEKAVTSDFKPTITIKLKNPTVLEAFTLYGAFRSSGTSRTFDGFPTMLRLYTALGGFPLKLKMYTSLKNQPLLPVALFQGETKTESTRYQYVLKNSVPCSRLQLEFIEFTPEIVFTGGKKCASVAEIMIMSSSIEDDSGSEMKGPLPVYHVNDSYVLDQITDSSYIDYELPKDEDYLFIVTKEFSFNNVTFSNPQNKISAIKSSLSSKVSIDNCKFSDLSVKSEEGKGGAINVANCVINMEQSEFIHCTSSTDGGGGGIYAILDKQIEDEFKIDNCKFESCSASYGGGIYLFSNNLLNSISITSCTFLSNSATSTKNDLLSGGSALFLNSLNGVVVGCKFRSNKGSGSFKLTNPLAAQKSKSMILSKSFLLIKNCLFEIGADSSSSISTCSSLSVPVSVDRCIFIGDLQNEAYHIECPSSSLRKTKKAMLHINACKFSCNKEKAMNAESARKFASFNVKKQEFNVKFVDINQDLDKVQWKNDEA